MKKEELIRYRAGLAALLVSGSMFLGGCSLGGSSSSEGFELTADEERNFVAQEDSYVDNDFIEKCYVVEAKSNITGESNIYIVRKKADMNTPSHVKKYEDIFTNKVIFRNDNNHNISFVYT